MTWHAPRIRVGSLVVKGEQVYTVEDFVDLSRAVLSDSAGAHSVCLLRDLEVTAQSAGGCRDVDLAHQLDAEWSRAFEIYRNLLGLLQLEKSERTIGEIAKVARVLDLSTPSVYRLLAKYKKHGRVSALLRKPRSDRGQSRLSSQVMEIVNGCIEKHYLTQNRKSVSSVWKEVDRACKTAGTGTPTLTTVRSVVYRLDPATVEARRYSQKRADEKFAPLLGAFPNANNPYEVIQIDHTPMDVIIVDDVHRRPIGRAYLTIAFDVRSKMVTGFVISIDNPGAMATGLCVAMSILPKDDWLKERALDNLNLSWPCYGFMRTIHTDNAKEFRGEMLSRACAEYNISLEKRKKGHPQYGGGVERAFRTFMSKVHEELPGTTRSNVLQRADYDSEGRAVLSLAALERWFAIYIVGEYHLSPHKGNDGVAPLDVWRKAHLEGLDGAMPVGLPLPLRPDAAERLRLDFLPLFEGTVQQYGVKNWSIDWYSPRIQRFIGEKTPDGKGRKFLCRYDPRDLQKIWLYDDRTREYITVPYRVSSRPPVSLWEIQRAKKQLKDQGSPTTNEALIFNAIDLAREVIQKEAKTTKSARRLAQRQLEHKKLRDRGAQRKSAAAPAVALDENTPLPEIDLLSGTREAQ